MKGIFITFEGIEGSGKSTLIGILSGMLNGMGTDHVVTREPGGTPLGRKLRALLLDPDSGELAPMGELLLYEADRAQHLKEIIEPALNRNLIVLCDRFSDATLAYQGFGRGLTVDSVHAIDSRVRGEVVPDLTVLLDLPVEAGLQRARNRNREEDNRAETRMDDETLAFHEAVRTGYLEIASSEPGRFLVLDGLLRPEDLASMVLNEMKARFDDAF